MMDHSWSTNTALKDSEIDTQRERESYAEGKIHMVEGHTHRM